MKIKLMGEKIKTIDIKGCNDIIEFDRHYVNTSSKRHYKFVNSNRYIPQEGRIW